MKNKKQHQKQNLVLFLYDHLLAEQKNLKIFGKIVKIQMFYFSTV